MNLEIPRGTLYGILGPNGAGKSTTLKLLTGRIKPTSGEITINGLNPWRDRVEVNKFLGYLPQNPTQHKEKTVFDFLKYMAKLQGFGREEAIREVREALHKVGLGRFEQNIIGKLSGGEKQRLGFSNALIGDPELLIMDEPTASLDPEGRIYVMELINSLAKDKSKTVIISSHILPEIQRMTDHIAIMSEGSVLTSGKMTELTKNIFDTEYEIKCSNPDLLGKVLNDAGFETRRDDQLLFVELNSSINEFWNLLPKFCVDNKISLQTCRPVRDPLETLFLQLVSKDIDNNQENGDQSE